MSTHAFALLLCINFLFVEAACIAPAFSQHRIQGARAAGLANTHVALEGPWSMAGNAAGIGRMDRPHLAFALERRFLLSELDIRALTAVVPAGKHVFGLYVNYFGANQYNEQLVSLGCGRALSDQFSVGFRINYHGLKIPGYTSQQAWSVAAGIQVSLDPGMRLGASVSNPHKAAFSRDLYAQIPFMASLGIAFDFSEKIMGTAALERASGTTRLRAGFEYRLHENLSLRGGISTAPFRQYGGLGLQISGLSLDLAAATHLQLGFTPQISLGYGF
ncbi:MAG: hypothetical protein FWJ85_03145 [Solitalea sp.]